jgi:hypothetical protein
METVTKRETSRETGHMAEGVSERFSGETKGRLEEEYGPCDCYCDCMNAFRWDCNEADECASACGVS